MKVTMRLLAATALLLLGLSGCGTATPVANPAADASAEVGGSDGSAGPDSAGVDGDGEGVDGTAADAAGASDAVGELGADSVADVAASDVQSSNKSCTFNVDCIDSERCECTLAKGCFCKVGVRGTGKSGVDTCKDGNDCETALCIEGPKYQSSYYCSGPCNTAADCAKILPTCSSIAFVGKICIRDPLAKP